MQDLPLTRDLVLIGGGHTHALVLKRWGMKPLAGVRVTVINPGPVAAYSGMLPGFVAGHYTRTDLELDILRLARFAGARAVLGRATGIDRKRKLIHVEGRPPIHYDVASIDIGITSAMPDLEGFSEHGIPAKPLERFATQWDSYRALVRAGETPPHMCVIGGGVAGAELAMAMAHALKGTDGLSVTLIDRGEILEEFRAPTRRALLNALNDAGVTLLPNTAVGKIEADSLTLTDGSTIQSHFTLGAAGARPYDWLEETDLTIVQGYVRVGPTLQSSDPTIFAVGDCAHLAHAPRPKAGVFAVREASVLFDNLRILLSEQRGKVKKSLYHPQKDYLKLISLGGKAALADKNGLRLKGAAMWRWKDSIDRKFMAGLKDLKPMRPPVLPDVVAAGLRDEVEGKKPMCGACGAKVGGDVLSRVLREETETERTDVIRLAGDDAAVLTHGEAYGGPRQVISVDHLRSFIPDPVLMTRITAIHALGDVWSMGAAPQSALATVTLPRLSPPLQEAWLSEIMSAARAIFAAEGAEIIGGHTSMGAEFSIGFTVTGLADAPITLSGAKVGDQIILTKPIGTGVLLAAEMAMQANGRDVATAYASMAQSSGEAARILSGAHAMTDVTGFGLAGHLLGICRASGVSATLTLSRIPLLDGALGLSQAGVASTILPANRAYAAEYDGPNDAMADLLFDPQTAGGLLACVGNGGAENLTKKLNKAGYNAAIIGEITEPTSEGGVALKARS
ncbi:selenide, water dikinase SelD [Celeribacter sp.]|uniref:selenide, water dikinase SelD n=1 Tax=Celeribacter sp. TaxID=1890673 RepID=UPI003A8E813D